MALTASQSYLIEQKSIDLETILLLLGGVVGGGRDQCGGGRFKQIGGRSEIICCLVSLPVSVHCLTSSFSH